MPKKKTRKTKIQKTMKGVSIIALPIEELELFINSIFKKKKKKKRKTNKRKTKR